VGEFEARQNGDTSPNIDEFTSRFSDLGDSLRSKLSELISVNHGQKQAFAETQTFISKTTVGDQQIGRFINCENVSDGGSMVSETHRVWNMSG
jgi:hypothetical protein